MTIGHYGVGFAAKRFAPGVPLFVLVTASLLPDILWFIFLAFGLEQGAGADGAAPASAAVVGGPFSHSLITSAAGAALAGVAYFYLRSDRRGALAVVLCAAIHWLLDALFRNHDLFLYPRRDTLVGRGLIQHAALATGAEIILFVAGAWFYIAGTRKVTGARDYGFWAFVALLLLAYVSYFIMPQSYARQAVWPVFLLMLSPAVYLFDRHRVKKEPQPKPEPTPLGPGGGSQRATYALPPPPIRAETTHERVPEAARVGPYTDTPRKLGKKHLFAAGVMLLILLLAGAWPLSMWLGANVGEGPTLRPGPVTPQPSEEERRVAEAVEKKVEQCGRVSPENVAACRKALESYKTDPVLRNLLAEKSEGRNVGGWTTVVVTNWRRNNFADVFTSPANLGLEPVEEPNSLRALERSGNIRIDKVSVRWDAGQKLFLVYLTITNLKGPEIKAVIPKGQIFELKWDKMLVPAPIHTGSTPPEPQKPKPKQNLVTPTSYDYTILKDDPSHPTPRKNLIMAVCLNEEFMRPGVLPSGSGEEEANLSVFKLNIDEFQKEEFSPGDYKHDPVDLQRRVHRIIREYNERARRISLPDGGDGHGTRALKASARTPLPSHPARRL